MNNLEGFDLFAELGSEVLDDLAAVARPARFADGAVIFREGDPAEDLFLVRSGQVQVERRRDDGPAQVINQLRPGDYAGLTSLFVDKPRSATLVAKSQVACWLIERKAIHRLILRHARLGAVLLRHLSVRFRTESAALAGPASNDGRTPIAVFDAKPYDRSHLSSRCPDSLALRFLDTRLNEDTAAMAVGCPAVSIFVNDRADAAVLARLAAGGTRHVALRCAGFNNVDLEAAKRCGLIVSRVPAYSPYAVAEHAAALLLALNRRIHRAYLRVREGNFTLNQLEGIDLHGRTCAVLGVGRIGQCFARIARGLGMRLLGWDARPDPALAAELGLEFVPLAQALAEADVISLHAPLVPETRHLICAETVATLKPGVLIINTSRGALIHTEALITGLKSGRIGGAGLDVYEEEEGVFFEDLSARPLQDDALASLLSYPNVLITSHQAFLTHDALDAIASTTLADIAAVLAGREVPPANLVAKPA